MTVARICTVLGAVSRVLYRCHYEDLQDRVDLANELHANGKSCLCDRTTKLRESSVYDPGFILAPQGHISHLKVIRNIVVFASGCSEERGVAGFSLVGRRRLRVVALFIRIALRRWLIFRICCHRRFESIFQLMEKSKVDQRNPGGLGTKLQWTSG